MVSIVDLKGDHKLTPEQREAWLKSQNYCCADPSCRKPFDETEDGKPVMDHSHENGYRRGYVHNGCNKILQDKHIGKFSKKTQDYLLHGHETCFMPFTQYVQRGRGTFQQAYKTTGEKTTPSSHAGTLSERLRVLQEVHSLSSLID